MAITKNEKVGLSFCLFVILLLIFLIIFSKQGYWDYRSLKKKEALIYEKTRETEFKNRRFESEIKSLQKDSKYIKHVAKHEHRMAEEDEIIFKEKKSDRETKP